MKLRAWILTAVFAGFGCAGRNLFREDALAQTRRHFETGAHDKVIIELRNSRIHELPRRLRPEAYNMLGISLEAQEKPAQALQLYQLAVGLYPKDLELLTRLADLLNKVSLPERARPYYQRVIKIHPNNAGAHLGLGGIYHKLGNLREAASHYRKALEFWSDNPDIWRRYAETLADSGDLDEATKAINIALDYKSNGPSLLTQARILRRRGFLSESYSSMSRAIDTLREDRAYRLEQGLWLLEDGRLEESARIAAAILEAESAEPLANWLIASIALRRGDAQSARKSLAVSAGAARTHPFIAKTARAMLKQLAQAQ